MTGNNRDFDKEAAAWDENPARVKLAKDIADAVSGEIKLHPDMDVLDYGCATGLLTLRFQPLVRSITGIDSSQGMLDVLNAKIERQGLTNVITRRLDLDKGDSMTGCYHLVVSSMTLHHIREIRPLMDLFYKIIAPSGHLCIADLDLDEGQFHSDNEGVFHFGFDRKKLRQVFVKAGFHKMQDKTAAGVMKFVVGEGMQMFTVFLMTGQK